MNQPLVSIGLPAFKGAHFAEALRSIKNQTYRSIEVIVQDDASPDDLKSIFDAEVGDDLRFSYARNEVNTAPYFVRNWQKTIDKAHGDFFVLAGDDDLYEPEFVEELVGLSEQYNDVDLLFGWQDIFDDSGVNGLPHKMPQYQTQLEWMISAIVSERQYQAQCALVKMSALRKIGGFVDLPAAWPSDLVTWSLLSDKGVVSSQKVLMHWRHDGNNVSAQNSEYWSLHKIYAALQIHSTWISKIESVVVKDSYEDFEKKIVLNKLRHGYLSWLIYPEFGRLSFCGLVKTVWMLLEQNKLTRRTALRLILGRAHRNLLGCARGCW